ncbi:MAG: lipopolysaccharide biosynthesis protein [Promethearchaeota archaeon]
MPKESEQMSLATKYARSTSLAWLRVILVRGIQLIYLFLIARLLLPEEMGILQAVALGTSFIGGVVTPWLAWVMQQKALLAKEKRETVGTVHQITVYSLILTSVFAPLISFVYLFSIGMPLISEIGLLFLIQAIEICIFQVIQGVHNSFLKLERAVIVGAIRTISNFLLPLLFFFVTGNFVSIIWGWIIADAIILLIIIPFSGLQRKLNLYKWVKPSMALLAFAAPVLLLYLFNQFRGFIDRFLILSFFGTADLAIYHLINRIPSIAQEAVMTLLLPFTPIMTKVFKDRVNRSGIAFGVTFKIFFHAILFVAVILIFCGEPIIWIILGSQYLKPESIPLLIFGTLTMVFYGFNSLFNSIRGAKGETVKMMLLFLTYPVNMLIFLFLFWIFGWVTISGILGISIAITFSYFATFIIYVWQTKELALIGKNPIVRQLFLIPPQLIVVAILSFWLAPLDIIDLLIITSLSFIVLLIISGLISCFNKEELDILSRVSKNRLDPLIKVYQKLGSWRNPPSN